MGPFLASAARRLGEPAVRSADTGADWRAAAGRFACDLAAAPGTAVPVAIDAPEPLAYAAHAVAALVAGRSILLCNPHWTAPERAAAEALRHAPPSRSDLPPDSAPAILVATGGSGGTLRFATHTPATLAAAAAALQAFRSGAPLHSLCLLPLHHISGFQQLVRALATGGDLLLADWHSVAEGRRPALPAAAGGWTLSLVPTQLQRLLADPAATSWLREFGAILLGGAPAGAALLERARAEQLPVAIAYGASEFGAAIAVQPPAEFLAGETGLRPLPHARLSILDSDTAVPLPGEAVGRISVAAPSLFLGYWPARRPPGPWHTDDLGRLDTAGRLHVIGRADEAINTGGEKVQPAEVEAALRATGAFSDVVVCGTPDPRWGECVTALFPAGDAPELARVERLLRAELGAHKLPRRWVPVAAWPRTAQGKTDRAALRRTAAGA